MTKPSDGGEPQAMHTDQLQDVVRSAEQGDEEVLAELRRLLDNRPDVWHRCGDLAAQAEGAWLELIAGSDVVLRESVRRELEELKAELAGGVASPLERLLVERVAATWLHVHYADALFAQLTAKHPTSAAHDVAQRRQNAAQTRHLQAVRALATVRKLLRPPLSPLELARREVAQTDLRRTAPVLRERAGVAVGGTAMEN